METAAQGLRLYIDLFLVFFRIGLFTLGGGYAMVPLIEREVVDRRHWLEDRDFIDVLAIAQSLPGPIAVNTSVFVGYRMRGIKGSLVGLLGTVLPSFICMIVIAAFFVGIKEDPTVAAVFSGIRPAVVALIVASVWTLGKKARLNWKTALIALGATLAVWLARISPAYVVVALALAGAMFPASAAKPAEAAAANGPAAVGGGDEAGAVAGGITEEDEPKS